MFVSLHSFPLRARQRRLEPAAETQVMGVAERDGEREPEPYPDTGVDPERLPRVCPWGCGWYIGPSGWGS